MYADEMIYMYVPSNAFLDLKLKLKKMIKWLRISKNASSKLVFRKFTKGH